MLTDFLKTTTAPEELATTLKVVREFMQHETQAEWVCTPFVAWEKLEELKLYLEHLVEGKPLDS